VWATLCAGSRQPFRLEIKELRRKDTGLKIDNLLLLGGGGSGIRLRVAERGVNGLLRKRRLASVPHDGCEKSQIRRRQRPAVDRHNTGRRICDTERGEAGGGIGVASVRVGNGNDSILDGQAGAGNGSKNRQPDADQSLVQ